jgi:hypothetical protein
MENGEGQEMKEDTALLSEEGVIRTCCRRTLRQQHTSLTSEGLTWKERTLRDRQNKIMFEQYEIQC